MQINIVTVSDEMHHLADTPRPIYPHSFETLTINLFWLIYLNPFLYIRNMYGSSINDQNTSEARWYLR